MGNRLLILSYLGCYKLSTMSPLVTSLMMLLVMVINTKASPLPGIDTENDVGDDFDYLRNYTPPGGLCRNLWDNMKQVFTILKVHKNVKTSEACLDLCGDNTGSGPGGCVHWALTEKGTCILHKTEEVPC